MSEQVHTMQDLQYYQSMPLEIKIRMTQNRIRAWVNEFGEDGVYVSFSGGKDSTVLLDICRKMYPNIKAMFVDVPTQYPELKKFALTYSNVDVVNTKIGYMQVVEKYGFPMISKEVSECVQGAKKYLTQVIEEMNNPTDRQTDRQLKYHYFYDRLTGQGKYAKFSQAPSKADDKAMLDFTRGGYDRKWRRLRGIGEFAKPTNEKPTRWKQSEIGDYVGNVDEGQRQSDKGEYP